MEWSEPVLLRYDFEIGPTRSPATVRLGYPQRVEDRSWTCAFQFEGVGDRNDHPKDGQISRVSGHHGWEALITASNAIRSRFEELTDARSHVPHEFVFPKFLPTSSWFDLYDWAKELVESVIDQNATSRSASPPLEQLARTAWDQPTLLDQQFKFVGGRKVSVRLGFPTFSQALKNWTCAFQLRGAEGNQMGKVVGENGLLAVANAADLIRASLDEIGAAPAGKDNHELIFPIRVPTQCGLELHRELSQYISAAIKDVEREDDEEAEERASEFNEMLSWLAPAARL